MPWFVKSDLDSRAVNLPTNGMQVTFTGYPDVTAEAVGVEAAVSAAVTRAEADEAVSGYRLARTQHAEAKAKAAAAAAEQAAAAAERDLLRLRPTATYADDLRRADARHGAAAEERDRAAADADAVGGVLDELYGRAVDVVARAGIAARAERVEFLRQERETLLGKLTAGGGPLLDSLAANVGASYALQESIDAVRDLAIAQALGPRPKPPTR